MENELKPCPFCGGNNLAIVQHGGGKNATHFVKCKNCGAHGTWVNEYTKEQAILAWNTRPNQEYLAESLGWLRRICNWDVLHGVDRAHIERFLSKTKEVADG